MRIIWVGNKAELSSTKHFNGKLNKSQMTQLAGKVISNITHVGNSDRANEGRTVAKIIWGDYNGIKFGMVVDGAMFAKGILEIVSFYDVRNADHKAKRFGMKKVSR